MACQHHLFHCSAAPSSATHLFATVKTKIAIQSLREVCGPFNPGVSCVVSIPIDAQGGVTTLHNLASWRERGEVQHHEEHSNNLIQPHSFIVIIILVLSTPSLFNRRDN